MVVNNVKSDKFFICHWVLVEYVKINELKSSNEFISPYKIIDAGKMDIFSYIFIFSDERERQQQKVNADTLILFIIIVLWPIMCKENFWKIRKNLKCLIFKALCQTLYSSSTKIYFLWAVNKTPQNSSDAKIYAEKCILFYIFIMHFF